MSLLAKVLLILVIILGCGGDDVQLPDKLLGVSDLLVRHPGYFCIFWSQQRIHVLQLHNSMLYQQRSHQI